MELAVKVNQTGPNSHWTSLINPICDDCGWRMVYKYHSAGRDLHILDKVITVTEGYYVCYKPDCSNKKAVAAQHPERIPYKKYSKSTFAQVIFKRKKGTSVKGIVEDMPYLSESICYSMINDYRVARRAGADERISRKFPPKTRISVSIDAMEPEKGQPALYTIREVGTGMLINAKFLEKSAAEDIYEVMHEIEEKYQLVFQGIISDKQRSITTMCRDYFPDVLHQYCSVHFMKNVTAELRGLDKSMQKDIRSDIRSLSILKTIAKNTRGDTPVLDEKEVKVLSETRKAILAVANEKKKEMFDLAGLRLYENLEIVENSISKAVKPCILVLRTPKYNQLINNLHGKLTNLLKKYKILYENIILGNELIHPMFDAVFKTHPKHPKRSFNIVVKTWEKVLENKNTSEVINGLIIEAIKLAKSYESGLFVWRRAKVPHHNNDTEQFYNEKKGEYRQYSRNKKIGITLQLTGLEEVYVPKKLTLEEIESDLAEIGSDKYWQIRREVDTRKSDRRFKKRCRKDIRGVLEEIFSHFDSLEGVLLN